MTSRPLVRPALLLAAATLLVVACGGPAPTETASPSAGPPTAEPSLVAPTLPPVGTTAPTPGFSFQLPSVDEELEAVLPDEIAGETVSKGSMSGAALIAFGGSEDLEEVLDAFDKEPSDLTAAIGSTPDVIMFAFRIDGVPAGGLFDAFVAAVGDGDQAISDVTISGKAVKKVVDPSGAARYLYFVDDVLVTVSGVVELDDAVLAEIFRELP